MRYGRFIQRRGGREEGKKGKGSRECALSGPGFAYSRSNLEVIWFALLLSIFCMTSDIIFL